MNVHWEIIFSFHTVLEKKGYFTALNTGNRRQTLNINNNVAKIRQPQHVSLYPSHHCIM